MMIKPLPSGARSLSIDTAYLMLDATVHPDGTIETHAVEIRDPRTPGEADAKLIAYRLPICLACDAMQKHKPELNAVKCKDCGCGNLKLATGRCPRGKWSTVKPPSPNLSEDNPSDTAKP